MAGRKKKWRKKGNGAEGKNKRLDLYQIARTVSLMSSFTEADGEGAAPPAKNPGRKRAGREKEKGGRKNVL